MPHLYLLLPLDSLHFYTLWPSSINAYAFYCQKAFPKLMIECIPNQNKATTRDDGHPKS